MGENLKRGAIVPRCHLKRWAVIGAAAIMGLMLCRAPALAYETQGAFFADRHFFQKPSSAVLDTGLFLSFSQRYYQAVETSLQNKSYFAFRYYLVSPYESFDKQQFISENPTQASDLARGALHNAIRQAVDDVELLEILRDYVDALTSIQMVIGTEGARLHGPSLTGHRLQGSALEANPNHEMALTGGLTFKDDLRLGLALTMTYRRILSKLSYYPASRNEIRYTAETRLTASTSIGLSYRRSQDGGAVLTTLSFLF
jgi:hypothetical protein